MRKLFLVSTLSLVSLVSGQAKTIENDQPVEITGTVTHDFSGKKAIKMEHLYLTSVNGDTVTMNERNISKWLGCWIAESHQNSGVGR